MSKLSKIFSNLNKDRALINITRFNKFSPDVEKGLSSLGWKQIPVMRPEPYMHWSMPPVHIYRDSFYIKGQERQGGTEWYSDLSCLLLPEHKPGLMTKILG